MLDELGLHLEIARLPASLESWNIAEGSQRLGVRMRENSEINCLITMMRQELDGRPVVSIVDQVPRSE